MARSKKLQDRRNQLIYDKYCELWQSGKREEVIWPELEDIFHLEETTIYRIVLRFIKNAYIAKMPNIQVPEGPTNADN